MWPPNLSKIAFLDVFKKCEKWCTLKQKISLTKVWKSKIWDDSSLAISIPIVVVYSVFSVGAVIMEKFGDQYCLFWKFSKKWKKREFWTAKFDPLKKKFHLFSSLIFLACPRATFWTPKLWSRTQNEDFQWWSTTDHKLSFLCGSKQWPFGLKQFVRFKAIYCPLKIYKVDTLIFFIWSV